MVLHLGLSFYHGGGKQKIRETPGPSNFLILKVTKFVQPLDQCY